MAANMMPNASVIGTDNTSPMTECPSIHASRQRKQMPSDHKNAVLRDLIFTRRFLSSSSLILSSLDRPADKLRIRIQIPKNRHKTMIRLPLISKPFRCLQSASQCQAGKKTIQGKNYSCYKSSYCLSSFSLFSFRQHKSSTVTPNIRAIR